MVINNKTLLASEVLKWPIYRLFNQAQLSQSIPTTASPEQPDSAYGYVDLGVQLVKINLPHGLLSSNSLKISSGRSDQRTRAGVNMTGIF